jgi:hypothetical protein
MEKNLYANTFYIDVQTSISSSLASLSGCARNISSILKWVPMSDEAPFTVVLKEDLLFFCKLCNKTLFWTQIYQWLELRMNGSFVTRMVILLVYM